MKSSCVNAIRVLLMCLPFRLKFRQFHAYPGRPQLQKLSSSSSCDAEYESKIEKFSPLLDAALLDLIALKKLSWSGIPKKVNSHAIGQWI